ncbi:MAG TPA: hypothetical protein VK174_08560 [Chitinophagales bacterium]|nr:hypothetical protein [Chitinophagales bacterium]
MRRNSWQMAVGRWQKTANVILLPIICALLLSSCHGDYTPKAKAYPRVIYPERKYELYEPEGCPFKFEKPVYTKVMRDSTYFGQTLKSDQCWLNVHFPSLNGVINLTYKDINDTMKLERLVEDAHKLAFKHTKKANYIDEVRLKTNQGSGGLLYDLGGDAASNVQFFLTDSNKHFIRGALYFYSQPNADSIAPVLDFVKQDLEQMIKTFEWR